MYKKTQLEKMHRIRPLCFLDFRKRHRPDSPSVFLIEENIGLTGFCVPPQKMNLVTLAPPTNRARS